VTKLQITVQAYRLELLSVKSSWNSYWQTTSTMVLFR